jgi:hypothetical protein
MMGCVEELDEYGSVRLSSRTKELARMTREGDEIKTVSGARKENACGCKARVG